MDRSELAVYLASKPSITVGRSIRAGTPSEEIEVFFFFVVENGKFPFFLGGFLLRVKGYALFHPFFSFRFLQGARSSSMLVFSNPAKQGSFL